MRQLKIVSYKIEPVFVILEDNEVITEGTGQVFIHYPGNEFKHKEIENKLIGLFERDEAKRRADERHSNNPETKPATRLLTSINR